MLSAYEIDRLKRAFTAGANRADWEEGRFVEEPPDFDAWLDTEITE